MRYFFHADTARYRRRQKSAMITLLVPLSAVSVFCVVNIVLNFRPEGGHEFTLFMLGVIAACAAVGMLGAFAAAYLTEKAVRRNSRYTYFDILPDGMIYSEYAGEYVWRGRCEVCRRLWYIPFAGFEGVQRDPKADPCSITLRGEIRGYSLPSRFLGYHVDETGATVFDQAELNQYGYEKTSALVIRGRLGSTKGLERAINHYSEEFRNRPAKKPFDISKHITRRAAKRPHTSNPALEAPSFERNWK